MTRRTHPHLFQRQRGAALLMAMVIVTVVATLASSMVWQQWRAVQVESAERGRAQSQWLLVGALDFAIMVLKDDGRQLDKKTGLVVDHLGEQWAQDLKEMRLSTFLAVDKDNTDDAPDAFLSGKVVDFNARYNLRNLLEDKTRPGAVTVNPAELDILRRLFTNIGEDPSLANRIADALMNATLAAMDTQQSFAILGDAGRAKAPVMPDAIDQLPALAPFLDAAKVQKLQTYITLLPYVNPPEQTPINPNTAPKEVIAAVLNTDTSTAERIVRQRQSSYFTDVADIQKLLPGNITIPTGANGGTTGFDLLSSYFEVTGILRLENQIMRERHLVKRTVSGRQVDVKVLNQARFSGVDSGVAP